MIISCGDQRLVGSARHQKVSHSRGLGPAARWGGVPKVGVVLQKVVPESPRLDGLMFQKLEWCSKKLSQNPRWSGVPKVGVVFQKVVPESPLCILLIMLFPRRLNGTYPQCTFPRPSPSVYHFSNSKRREYACNPIAGKLSRLYIMRRCCFTG